MSSLISADRFDKSYRRNFVMRMVRLGLHLMFLMA
jgi:hypothetical protein